MISWVVLVSVVVYILYSIWDRRQVKDEREQLIDLKTAHFQSQVTVAALLGLSLLYQAGSELSPGGTLFAMVIANLYSEILGKIFFRFRI